MQTGSLMGGNGKEEGKERLKWKNLDDRANVIVHENKRKYTLYGE
jgi:hypothetical protein